MLEDSCVAFSRRISRFVWCGGGRFGWTCDRWYFGFQEKVEGGRGEESKIKEREEREWSNCKIGIKNKYPNKRDGSREEFEPDR